MKIKTTGDTISPSESRDANHIGNSDKASKEKSGKDAIKGTLIRFLKSIFYGFNLTSSKNEYRRTLLKERDNILPRTQLQKRLQDFEA
jgi:hypothetical protein